MTAICGSTSLIGTCALSCFVFLMCSTFTGVVAEPRMTSPLPQPTSKQRSFRNQSQNSNARHKSSYHRPLTPEQKADQNLQFMLSLYRSAAEPDGRLKQYRRFGSNTVRMLKPSVLSQHHLTTSKEHHYTFTVEYSLDSLPLEQLIRASFLHFRSLPSSSGAHGASPLPPCMARVASLGVTHHGSRPPPGESVPLQLHHQWTETDVTAHVSRHILQRTSQTSLTLVAQYRCTDPGYADGAGDYYSWRSEEASPSWRRMMSKQGWRMRRRRRWGRPTGDAAGYHLGAPSLLLYLEEQRESQDWMKELLAGEGESVARLWGPLSYASHHHHQRAPRSTEEPSDESLLGARAFSPEALKDAVAVSASSSSNASSEWAGDTYEAVPGRPGYRRKTSLPRNRCRLHSLRLSFEALGLGQYFIAPPVYNPRYCQGECPRVLHYGYHSPNHAIIQNVMRELGVSEDVPAPSCVPYKYMPMSVLVRNKKRVEYRELEDMIAESCTCR
ncbi:bone morphogenetic protein 15-like [Gadus chalcogrammus]|uniref:bone morphogenetic protein 15-like n=1 Tax=Gadus chalcogrammus TaxID=1042646 RepID=UPI0024C4C204|nr:bone morphogenetic protein 15-like [Gadus chalcogrammus]